MIKNAKIFYIGICIFLIPFLGLPTSGKTFVTVVCGLVLVFLSVQITLPKRPLRAATTKKTTKKEKIKPISIEYVQSQTDLQDAELPTVDTTTNEIPTRE